MKPARTLATALLSLSFTAAGCGAPGAPIRPSLGSLVLRDHIVVVEQTSDGLRYTIEGRDGSLVAENLTRDELESLAPGALRHLETGTALDARVDVWAGR